MANQKVAVIGVGNMGGRYARLLQDGAVEGMELAALTRVRGTQREQLAPSIVAGVPVYASADELFVDVENGTLTLDAVFVVTPHYSHEELTVRAFQNGLHVLCEKPAGVYSAQARRMNQAAQESGKQYGMVFHQRLLPLHQRLKEIVDSGKYGALKRLSWTITDWYRPEKYFSSSSWHSTWATDGGGVILNQCSHNLDLICWLFGLPARVQAFCHEGRYHHIEVEDDVTAYFEWPNGATGTFVSSTGEAPGVNRLEIALEEALLICENGELRICELAPALGMLEAEYRRTSEQFFGRIQGVWHTEQAEPSGDLYCQLLQNFSAACNGKAALVSPGCDGYSSLLLTNAIYLSSWQKKMISLPAPGTPEEMDFEKEFETFLSEKCGK